MPDWLLDVAMGVLGAGGAAATNRANARMAREQMNFQREMADTAVQRRVKDLKEAGLNVGLAYEQQAASPGGASATLGDPIGQGISSAMAANRQRTELKELKANNKVQRDLMQAQNEAATGAANVAREEQLLRQQHFKFNAIIQPLLARQQSADTLLTEYALPGAKNEHDYEKFVGPAAKAIGSAKTLSDILGAALGGGRAGKAMSGITRAAKKLQLGMPRSTKYNSFEF